MILTERVQGVARRVRDPKAARCCHEFSAVSSPNRLAQCHRIACQYDGKDKCLGGHADPLPIWNNNMLSAAFLVAM